jgi:hypothetical protein
VLCIQDGTDVNYSSLVQCEGLGVIGTNQTGAKSGGLHLQSLCEGLSLRDWTSDDVATYG